MRLSWPVAAACLAVSAQANAQVETMDANRDGRISRAEFVANRDAQFPRLDRNGDGVLGRDDFPRAAMVPRLDAFITRTITTADRNGDQAVSRTELMQAPTPAFDRADADRNGVLAGDEIARFRAELTAQR